MAGLYATNSWDRRPTTSNRACIGRWGNAGTGLVWILSTFSSPAFVSSCRYALTSLPFQLPPSRSCKGVPWPVVKRFHVQQLPDTYDATPPPFGILAVVSGLLCVISGSFYLSKARSNSIIDPACLSMYPRGFGGIGNRLIVTSRHSLRRSMPTLNRVSRRERRPSSRNQMTPFPAH